MNLKVPKLCFTRKEEPFSLPDGQSITPPGCGADIAVRQRQENRYEFTASMVYIFSSRSDGAT